MIKTIIFRHSGCLYQIVDFFARIELARYNKQTLMYVGLTAS